MTNENWNILVSALKSVKNPPAWLERVGKLSYEEALQLPKLGSESAGSFAAPCTIEKELKPDYLDFLREQIQLNARGQEWTDILRKRLSALEPFVGKEVLTANFYQMPDSATLYINPETEKLFHLEIS